MPLIFCRHGQTVFNAEDRFQGVSDSPLTPKGIEQAKKLSRYLQKHKLVNFFLSPLPRVLETFKYVSAERNWNPIMVSDLREISYGEWETKTKREIESAQPQLWKQRQLDRFNFIHPGYYQDNPGESYGHLYQRIPQLLKQLGHEDDNGRIKVVISHLGLMLCVQKYFQNLSEEVAGHLRIPNDTVLLVDKMAEGDYKLTEEQL